jgi:hypothetical protein
VEKRPVSYFGCVFAVLGLLIIGLAGYVVLAPAFFDAREAARESQRFDHGKQLAEALKRHAALHDGRLPGAAWSSELESLDPGLESELFREVDGRRLGFGAVPGILQRPLRTMAPETVLFVETTPGRPNSIVHDLSEIGGRLRKSTAVAITVENVLDGAPISMSPLVRIGMQLQRQHAPNLK